MTEINNALNDLKNLLESQNIPYMIIGGLANLCWGEPRLTQDIDVTIAVSEKNLKNILKNITEKTKQRVKNPIKFANDTRVLPLQVAGIDVDVVLAGLEYEKQAIKRSVEIDFEGILVKVCTSEDLIIHKAISERERDLEDIEGVLLKQGNKLDLKYIMKWLDQFTLALQKPVNKRFLILWNKVVK